MQIRTDMAAELAAQMGDIDGIKSESLTDEQGMEIFEGAMGCSNRE